MADRSGYVPGTPCWAELGTPDVDGARHYYAELFGWQFSAGSEAAGGYTMALLHGVPVAGLVESSGLPALWTTYLASADCDATALRIRDHGGTIIVDPMDVLAAGRMCIAADPAGAVFGVWEAGQHPGARRVNEPSALCWNEVNTRDPKAADEFYREVFSLRTEQIGDGVNFDYAVFLVEGRQVAGRLRMNDDWPADAVAHWSTYFAVDDCDKAADRVSALGGTVTQQPVDSPYGRIAQVSDPWGAQLSIMRLAANPPR